MENRSIVSIADYGKEKIQYLLDMAAEFERQPKFCRHIQKHCINCGLRERKDSVSSGYGGRI